jgi:hypothetical protein
VLGKRGLLVVGIKAAVPKLKVGDPHRERALGLGPGAADREGQAVFGALHQREPALLEIRPHPVIRLLGRSKPRGDFTLAQESATLGCVRLVRVTEIALEAGLVRPVEHDRERERLGIRAGRRHHPPSVLEGGQHMP